MKFALSLVNMFLLSTMATSATAFTPVSRSGSASAYDRQTGNFMGYVARGSMPNNYYFTVTPNKTQAIPIDFVDPRNLTLTFNINLSNGSSYLGFGAVIGPASAGNDLLRGSSNYALLTGTAQTPAGQPTTAGGSAASCGLAIESQIWTFDGTTYEFTPRWINSNGPAPELYMLLSQDSAQNLYLTGDMSSFEGSFGTNFHIVDLFYERA